MADGGQQESAAAAAAERVRAIVEAAERSAAELEAAARAEAEQIRADARRDVARARELVGGVAERADELERRLEELRELVLASLAGLQREVDALRSLAGEPAAEVATDVDERLIAEAEAIAAREPEVGPAGSEAPDEPVPPLAPDEPVPPPDPDESMPPLAPDEPVPPPAPDEPIEVAGAEPGEPEEEGMGGLSAAEGARVLALKMALDGIPRAETARYLHENFELEDPEGLLDEVYAKARR